VLDRPRTRLLAWLAAYAVASLLVVLLVHLPARAAWYPTIAIAVGLLLRGGPRWWFGVLGIEITVAAAQLHAGPLVAVGVGTVSAVEAGVGWWLVRRLRLDLEATEDVLRVVVVAAVMASIGALGGTAVAGLLSDGVPPWTFFYLWWMGDMTSLVTVLPLVILIYRRDRGGLRMPAHTRALLEIPLLVLFAAFIVLGSVAVTSVDPNQERVLRLLWIAPVLWAAIRYERVMAALVATEMAVIALYAFTRTELIPGRSDLDTAILQLSILSLASLGMAVATATHARHAVTDRLAEALRDREESERRYTSVFVDGPAIQFLVDPETAAFIDVSEAAARFYGYTREQMRAMHIRDLNSEPPSLTRDRLARGMTGGTHLTLTHRLADGTTRRMDANTGPVEIGGRRVLHTILRDATEELAARSEVARLAAAVESSAETLVTTDLEGTITGWNAAAEILYGYDRQAAIGRDIDEILGPLDIPTRELGQMASEGRSVRFGQVVRRTADGERIPVDLTISPIVEDGVVVGMSRISHDLRHILREEERVRRSEALLADAAAIGGMGSWEIDLSTGDATWSEELYRIAGVEPGDTVHASTLEDLAHPDDAPRVALAVAGASDTAPFVFRLNARDGKERWVVATWRRVRGVDGAATRIVGVLRDVTEEKALEGQLRQAQRLETIGLLAGGVAHDFNNLLTAIAGFADLAGESARMGLPADADLEQVQAAVERGRALTSQLLTFGRRAAPQPRPVDMGKAVSDLIAFLRRLLGEDIAVHTDLEPGTIAFVDPGSLNQVITNLAINARDAMPDGGTLRIAVGRVPQAPGGGNGSGPPAMRVWLEVEDDGSGIASELLDKIFQPFFTTKENGRGTGLGLATVHNLVSGASGRITVDSSIGHGTTFRVELPGIAAGAFRPEPREARDRTTGEGLVLFVEDEELVRRMGIRVLERAGFRVVGAANVPDALQLAARERPDILVTDIVLPGIGDGVSLAEDLHARWPDLPILLMTGYTERVPPAWASLLAKPYEVDELTGRVRRLLDDARAGAGAGSGEATTGPTAG
jgi:two-component system, cell cycle sensor histidine kinase and response regulator CckA